MSDAPVDHWGELLVLRDKQRAQRKNGLQVVKEASLPLENSRQGLMQWYLHPSVSNTVLSTLIFFKQIIPPGSRSGRVKFQGGQVLMILEGRGYTMVDGVKHAWQAGDVVNLPLRSAGITVQHFNADSEKEASFVAAEPNWFECTGVDRGCGFEQIEDAPDYRK
jgi:gentisate 1,2-dioxygenase